MIVLDEQLKEPRIAQAIARWHKGTVSNITDLRPGTLILDPDVPVLLRTVKQPTFVTINHKHFWHRVRAEESFCIICILLPPQQALQVPALLREALSLEQYHTKRQRMGRVISLRGRAVEDYAVQP